MQLMLRMVELNSEMEGFLSYNDPAEAKRPRSLYDINS